MDRRHERLDEVDDELAPVEAVDPPLLLVRDDARREFLAAPPEPGPEPAPLEGLPRLGVVGPAGEVPELRVHGQVL